MVVHLLDVNVLPALVDPLHVHNEATFQWFSENRDRGWATCPLTENGFVRILSHPSNTNRPGDASVACEMLMAFCDDPGHRFWSDDVRIGQIVSRGFAFSHRQVTDLYLLGLAVRNGGKLATLDRRIPSALVEGGEQALAVVPV